MLSTEAYASLHSIIARLHPPDLATDPRSNARHVAHLFDSIRREARGLAARKVTESVVRRELMKCLDSAPQLTIATRPAYHRLAERAIQILF